MSSQLPCFSYRTGRTTIHIFLNHIVLMNDVYCKVTLSNGSVLELEKYTYARLREELRM